MSKGKTIASKKIIEMYEQGFSCKDICLACDMSALTVRNFLRAAGYNTRNYRKVSISITNKVVLLIKSGYSYNRIEKLLHVSTHLIREIVLGAGLVGLVPKYHHPVELNLKESDVSLELVESLRKVYRAGERGLVRCSDELGLSDNDFLWFVFHLTDEEIKTHCDKLEAFVRRLNKQGLPVTAIAKRLDISPSIVKKII